MTASSRPSTIWSTRPEHRLGVVGGVHPVDGHRRDVGALPAQRVRRPSTATGRAPGPRSAGRRGRGRAGAPARPRSLGLRRPQLAQAAPAQRPDALGAAGQDLGLGRARASRSASSPQRSAAANQAFMPMPVVARNMSTGAGQHLLGRRAQRDVVDPVGVHATAPAPTRPRRRAARAARSAPRPCGRRSPRSGSRQRKVARRRDCPRAGARRGRPGLVDDATSYVGTRTAASSRHCAGAQVERPACASGEATNGTSSSATAVPTMPRASTRRLARTGRSWRARNAGRRGSGRPRPPRRRTSAADAALDLDVGRAGRRPCTSRRRRAPVAHAGAPTGIVGAERRPGPSLSAGRDLAALGAEGDVRVGRAGRVDEGDEPGQLLRVLERRLPLVEVASRRGWPSRPRARRRGRARRRRRPRGPGPGRRRARPSRCAVRCSRSAVRM